MLSQSLLTAAKNVILVPRVNRDCVTHVNPFTPKSDLIDFTLSNARRFYSSKGDPLGVKGLSYIAIAEGSTDEGPKNSAIQASGIT